MTDSTFVMQGMSQALVSKTDHTTDGGNQSPVSRELAVSGWKPQQSEDYTSSGPVVTTQESDAKKPLYPWNEAGFEIIGPKIKEVEYELFGPEEERGGHGLDFSKVSDIDVFQESDERVEPIESFENSKLHKVVVENAALAGYRIPTPIQKYVIPAVLSGKDVIGIAQTGSGKTAAYMIPIMSLLMGKAKRWAADRPPPTAELTFEGEGATAVKAEPLVMIVVPTRELAIQIFNEARKFAYRSMLRPCVVYGGVSIRDQRNLLARGCDILVGTPGRLKAFVNEPRFLTLERLRYTVIDEADEMLGNDWTEELDPILRGGGQDEGNVKFCLFSATFPKEARDLASEYLSEQHVRLRVGRAGRTTECVMQRVIQVERDEKRQVLMNLLAEMPGCRTIIFVNAVREVDNLDDFLYNNGLPVTSIHRDRSQYEREMALRAFRAGSSPIIISTGVMARGIDVKNVQHVINYDLPTIEWEGIQGYTHRIGRTGRIGNRGVATSFFTERDEPLGSVLARTLLEAGQEIPDFLQCHIEGMTKETVKFETESDFDEGDLGQPSDLGGGSGDGGEGWGTEDKDNAQGESSEVDPWGAGANDGAKNDTAPAW